MSVDLGVVEFEEGFLVKLGLLLGAGGWLLHASMIWLSMQSEEKWTLLVKYNEFAEAGVELVLFPGLALFILYVLYRVRGRRIR